MTTELESDLLKLINEEITLDASVPIDRSTDLLMTGLVDSLGVVQIVDWMEQTIGVEIDPVDVVIENFQTVDLMLSFLDRLRAQS